MANKFPITFPVDPQIFFSRLTGAPHGDAQQLSDALNLAAASALGGSVRVWSFQTNQTIQYAGGFYDFAGTDDDFSPAVLFGSVGVGIAAHVLLVTGAIPGAATTIRVSGTSIDDSGVQAVGDSEDVVIPAGTAVDSYFETFKKWNGRVTIETVAGPAITCNYGWTKYHDFMNTDFRVLSLEVIWESDSSDSTSDVQLVHHKAAGWTFVGGSEPVFPTPVASRNADHAGQVKHRSGPGSWKRVGLDVLVNGADSEGILFCVTSGTTGVGALSFRSMTLEVTLSREIVGLGR